MKKSIVNIFKSNGLKITIEANLHQTDFLDVTMDLAQNQYFPYRKPNSDLLYINHKSNHPLNILKQLPQMIESRLSRLSSNNAKFANAKYPYENALKKSGFSKLLSFSSPTTPSKRRRNRSRNIIWFNPPFSMHVSTNIGKQFLKVVNKHFTSTHRYHKIFNKNNLKISYFCMPNMKTIVHQQNRKLLSITSPSTGESTQPLNTACKKKTEKTCNCRNKNLCPLNQKCLQERVVYKATVQTSLQPKSYIGSCATTFKTRYNNHKQSFKHINHRNDTALSKFIWKLKEANMDFTLSWSIVSSVSKNFCKEKTCHLCLTEKTFIIKEDPINALNTRREILNKCRHRNKFELKKIQ